MSQQKNSNNTYPSPHSGRMVIFRSDIYEKNDCKNKFRRKEGKGGSFPVFRQNIKESNLRAVVRLHGGVLAV